MGVGHLAVGLMLKRVDPRINLGPLFFATLLPDFLFGIFYWLGLDHASVPANYQNAKSVVLVPPYSHGLVSSVLWSGLMFWLATYFWSRGNNKKVGLLFGFAVFSHFILDFIVHVRDLPTLGPHSYRLGLGLWDHMGIALTLELLLVLTGLILYMSTPREIPLSGRFGILILMVVFSVLTVVGMTSSAPPSMTVLAVSWLVTPLVLSGLAFWLDRKSFDDSKHVP